jgi:hypothetical protein
MKHGFSLQNFKNPQISNFMKIRPVGAELCHVDGQRNRKLILAFRNAKAPKKVPNITPRDNHASTIPNQIRNSEWLVSFGFFFCPNYQSIGGFKYLNLIAQVTLRCSCAVLSYSDLASRDLFEVEWDYMRQFYTPGRYHLQLSSSETLTPETRKSNSPKQNYQGETVNSAALPLSCNQSPLSLNFCCASQRQIFD